MSSFLTSFPNTTSVFLTLQSCFPVDAIRLYGIRLPRRQLKCMVRVSMTQGNQGEMQGGGTDRGVEKETEIIASAIASALLSWKKLRFVRFPYMYLLFSSVSILNDV